MRANDRPKKSVECEQRAVSTAEIDFSGVDRNAGLAGGVSEAAVRPKCNDFLIIRLKSEYGDAMVYTPKKKKELRSNVIRHGYRHSSKSTARAEQQAHEYYTLEACAVDV